MTKRQRQNAQRRENEKATKAEGEAQRVAVLAKHKRELESARMLEQYSGKSGGKSSSGGMKASVDERGKLVWEWTFELGQSDSNKVINYGICCGIMMPIIGAGAIETKFIDNENEQLK